MKNTLIGILLIVSLGSLVYGYRQKNMHEGEASPYVSENVELKKQVEQYRTEAAELQKMYDQASVEMQVQRTICEEQLKALKSK